MNIAYIDAYYYYDPKLTAMIIWQVPRQSVIHGY